MDFNKAKSIYNLPYNFNKKDVLTRYRELLKLNHPDSNLMTDLSIDDIRLAKEVLIGYLDDSLRRVIIKKDIKEVINISLEDLIKVYKYKEYNNLTVSKLSKNNSFIRFTFKVNGENIVLIGKFNSNDKYKFDICLDYCIGDRISIDIFDCHKDIKVACSNVRLSFNLDCNIYVMLNIAFKL